MSLYTDTHELAAWKRAEANLRDSEARLRAIVDTAVDGIVTINERGTIETVNPAVVRIFGYEPEELIGQNVNILMPQPYHREHHRYLADYVRTGERKVIGIGREVVGKRKDGGTFPVDLAVSEVRLRNRRIFTGVVRDISARKMAEEQIHRLNEELERRVNERTAELAAANEALERAFEASAIGMALVALDGRWLKVNSSVCPIVGYSEAELLAMTFQDITHPDDVDCDVDLARRVSLGLIQSYQMEKRYIHKDGHIVWVILSVSLVRDATAKPSHFVSQILDITSRKHAEEELRRARDEAMAATRAKSEFLANMSHEIRTPMNGVLGMNELLLDTPLGHVQRGYAETIRSSGEALLTVINDILDFSKIEAGKLILESAEFDLRTLMEEVTDLVEPCAHQKALRIECRVDGHLPSRLVGDPTRIRQVLTNLAGNAVKFTDCGCVGLEANLMTEGEDEVTLRILVKDTGIGIPEQRQTDIFESFTQIEQGSNRRHGGTGLGLAICRSLVDLMGGRIGLESCPGVGSTFWFELALGKGCEPAGVHVAPLDDMRVLVIDDQESSRLSLQEMLHSWNCRSESATSGAEALAKLLANPDDDPFDLILIDQEMPGMDGDHTARAINASPRYAQVPLVLVTALGSYGIGESDDHTLWSARLSKPVRRSHLHNILRRIASTSEPFRTMQTAVEERASELDGPIRVLLAEDNDVNRRVAVGMVERLGYTVEAVCNGRQALEVLDRDRHDLVLMDIQMPEMDGFTATAKIREYERGTGSRIPIVAMTAHAMHGDRERCLAAGMDGYVSKPLRPAPLREVLHVWAAAERQPTDAKGALGGLKYRSFSPEALGESCGNDPELTAEVLTLMLEGVPARVEQLRKAVADCDEREVSREAHALKGTFMAVGAETLANACQQMVGLAATSDFAAIDELNQSILLKWLCLNEETRHYLQLLSL